VGGLCLRGGGWGGGGGGGGVGLFLVTNQKWRKIRLQTFYLKGYEERVGCQLGGGGGGGGGRITRRVVVKTGRDGLSYLNKL